MWAESKRRQRKWRQQIKEPGRREQRRAKGCRDDRLMALGQNAAVDVPAGVRTVFYFKCCWRLSLLQFPVPTVLVLLIHPLTLTGLATDGRGAEGP